MPKYPLLRVGSVCKTTVTTPAGLASFLPHTGLGSLLS